MDCVSACPGSNTGWLTFALFLDVESILVRLCVDSGGLELPTCCFLSLAFSTGSSSELTDRARSLS